MHCMDFPLPLTDYRTSRFILKEQLNSLIIFGGVFIMVGSALAVTFGTHGHDGIFASEVLTYISS